MNNQPEEFFTIQIKTKKHFHVLQISLRYQQGHLVYEAKTQRSLHHLHVCPFTHVHKTRRRFLYTDD
jgi:hypothetical protein